MDVDDEAAKRKVELAMEATSKGRIFFSKEAYIAEFNRDCDHGIFTVDDHYEKVIKLKGRNTEFQQAFMLH